MILLCTESYFSFGNGCSSRPRRRDLEAEKKKSDPRIVKKNVGDHVKARNL